VTSLSAASFGGWQWIEYHWKKELGEVWKQAMSVHLCCKGKQCSSARARQGFAGVTMSSWPDVAHETSLNLFVSSGTERGQNIPFAHVPNQCKAHTAWSSLAPPCPDHSGGGTIPLEPAVTGQRFLRPQLWGSERSLPSSWCIFMQSQFSSWD